MKMYMPLIVPESGIIDIHATAGKGDVGFCNFWTLEISVKMPVRVYAGMPIGQLIYFVVEGDGSTTSHGLLVAW